MHSTQVRRILLVGGLMATAAIGFAGPASADPAPGSYEATVIDVNEPGQGVEVGQTMVFLLTPECGPDCMNMTGMSFNTTLHRTGDAFSGTRTLNSGVVCTLTLTSDAAGMTAQCLSMVAHYTVVKTT